MTSPKDLDPNDCSDSDWYEFTGGLQRPFRSKEDQERWIEENGYVLPESVDEVNCMGSGTTGVRAVTPDLPAQDDLLDLAEA